MHYPFWCLFCDTCIGENCSISLKDNKINYAFYKSTLSNEVEIVDTYTNIIEKKRLVV